MLFARIYAVDGPCTCVPSVWLVPVVVVVKLLGVQMEETMMELLRFVVTVVLWVVAFGPFVVAVAPIGLVKSTPLKRKAATPVSFVPETASAAVVWVGLAKYHTEVKICWVLLAKMAAWVIPVEEPLKVGVPIVEPLFVEAVTTSN